jgi:hypothetical protein
LAAVKPRVPLEVGTHYGASTVFRPRSSLRIRGIRWLADGCRCCPRTAVTAACGWW